MADLPSIIQKINDIEVAQEAPITEATERKIGQSLNGLIDRLSSTNLTEFLTNGTYQVPDGIQRLEIIACGGGGGGGSGTDGVDHGGQGGCGALPTSYFVDVTPGLTYSVTIGAGGAGGAFGNNPGSPGGNTVFSGNGYNLVWPGAQGGLRGTEVQQGASVNVPASDLNFQDDFESFNGPRYAVRPDKREAFTIGGWGFFQNVENPSNPGYVPGAVSNQQNGENSIYANGGSSQIAGGGSPFDTGGGGGAGLEAGGNGATLANNNTPGGRSAGGGGGFVNGFAGAAGGPGYMAIRALL